MSSDSLEVRVAQKRCEAEGICSFELVSPQGGPLPPFSAGSHIDVHVPGGLVRQYSLCNRPGESGHYEIAVLLDPASRGGSVAMHRSVRAGDILRIGLPRNHFALRETTVRPLLLAGGIGITPILCMAEQLAQARVDFEMHYWSRSQARTAFFERIRASEFAQQVTFHFDDGPTAQWMSLSDVLVNPVYGRRAYICGPTGFLASAREAARKHWWREDHIHFESFKSEAADNGVSAAFEVQIASTGAVHLVPAEKSVAQVLAAASVKIPLACEQGICGTCVTRVLSGVPDHRDLYLTAEERAQNDRFTPCCSRSLTPRLVLDL